MPQHSMTPLDPSSVQNIIALQAVRCPERIALVEDGTRCTYGELQESIERLAPWLAAAGARPRDRIMLVCENAIAAVALYFACLSTGAWPVIVNARLSAHEIDDIRAHSGCRLLVFTTACSVHAREHAKRYDARLTAYAAGLGEIARTIADQAAEQEAADLEGESEIAAVIYTTGTTGRPKGVMLTHRNLLFVARATAEARRLTEQDRVYATLPISHTLGLTGVLLGSLLSGAEVHLSSRFDPSRLLAALKSDGISVLIGTPSMYALLIEQAKRKGCVPIAAPALRLISSAGAPLDAATKGEAEAAFRQTLHNGYGISECGPSISLTSFDAPRADCSVGRLLPGVEAKLLKDGAECASGDVGELWVRSPGVMKGYYKAPEETGQVIDKQGWFRTGDLARFEDGHLFIAGRAKEMIVRFGFNVYPAEIEAVLNGCPDVLRSAVVGRESGSTEEIIAFVQPAPGAGANTESLADYAASRLAPYKRPTEFRLISEMPMAPNGKILKANLLELAAGAAA
ncbi:MAG: AMP-binding protein [Alphaproteobacteria bacterium]|nr:AMP-binding protein [Alphaproteobacteria bacterium]